MRSELLSAPGEGYILFNFYSFLLMQIHFVWILCYTVAVIFLPLMHRHCSNSLLVSTQINTIHQHYLLRIKIQTEHFLPTFLQYLKTHCIQRHSQMNPQRFHIVFTFFIFSLRLFFALAKPLHCFVEYFVTCLIHLLDSSLIRYFVKYHNIVWFYKISFCLLLPNNVVFFQANPEVLDDKFEAGSSAKDSGFHICHHMLTLLTCPPIYENENTNNTDMMMIIIILHC